jgi:hypothetical protein
VEERCWSWAAKVAKHCQAENHGIFNILLISQDSRRNGHWLGITVKTGIMKLEKKNPLIVAGFLLEAGVFSSTHNVVLQPSGFLLTNLTKRYGGRASTS